MKEIGLCLRICLIALLSACSLDGLSPAAHPSAPATLSPPLLQEHDAAFEPEIRTFIVPVPNASQSPSASPQSSAFPSASPTPASSALPSPEISASASSEPVLTAPTFEMPLTSVPSRIPSISIGNDNAQDFAQGQASTTFELHITDWNRPTGLAGCGSMTLPFSVETRGGLTRQQITGYQLEQLDGKPLTFAYQGLPVGARVGLAVPARYDENGSRLTERIEAVATATAGGNVVKINVPVKMWAEGGPYQMGYSSSINLLSESAPKQAGFVANGSAFEKSWSIKNETSHDWVGWQLVSVTPKTSYAPALESTQPAFPIPTTLYGQGANLAVKLQAPRRAGWYQAVWRFQDPGSGLFKLSDTHVALTVQVEGQPFVFQGKGGDSYSQADSLMIGPNDKTGPLPINQHLVKGTYFDMYYQLKNTGSVTWENRKLSYFRDGIKPEHLLKPHQESFDIPRTLPGQTVKIGPVKFQVTTMDSHYAAWKILDASGQPAFETPVDAFTQVTVGPVPVFCSK